MALNDWNLEASEEAGQQEALQEGARSSEGCDTILAASEIKTMIEIGFCQKCKDGLGHSLIGNLCWNCRKEKP